jgi:hypothetical protein
MKPMVNSGPKLVFAILPALVLVAFAAYVRALVYVIVGVPLPEFHDVSPWLIMPVVVLLPSMAAGAIAANKTKDEQAFLLAFPLAVGLLGALLSGAGYLDRGLALSLTVGLLSLFLGTLLAATAQIPFVLIFQSVKDCLDRRRRS